MKAPSAVAQAALDLGCNLKSGLRLAFGLPVSPLAFRVNVRQLIALAVLGIVVGALVDYVHAGPHPLFAPHAIVYEGFSAAVLLFIAAVLSAAFSQPHLRLALPVVLLASVPVLGVFSLILMLPGNRGGLFGYPVRWEGAW